MSAFPPFPTSPRSGAKVALRCSRRPRSAAARSGAARGVPDGEGRAGAADPRVPGRRRLAGDDDPLAARERLPHAPRRHPRQRRLLGGGLLRLEARLEGFAEAHRRARRDHRPEPRRRLRPRARRPPARPRRRASSRSARPTVSQLSVHPLVLAQVGARRRARHGRVPGMFRPALPARRMLRELPRRRWPAPFPAEVGYIALYSRSRRRRRLARVPGPDAEQIVEVRASHCGMARQRARSTARSATRSAPSAPATRTGPRRPSSSPSRLRRPRDAG